jgi:hypothetical protein
MPGDGGLDEYIGQSVGGIQLSRSGRTNQMAGVRACYQQGKEIIMKGKCWSVEYFYIFVAWLSTFSKGAKERF